MVLTRVRFVTARTFPELESAVNAALAELDQHPDVQAIARIAFQPSVTGRNRCVRMRLSPPARPERWRGFGRWGEAIHSPAPACHGYALPAPIMAPPGDKAQCRRIWAASLEVVLAPWFPDQRDRAQGSLIPFLAV